MLSGIKANVQVSAPIEEGTPRTWKGLELRVGRILTEAGYKVEVQKALGLARGEVTVDVFATEDTNPPNVVAVECKLWKKAVTQTVVHAFRTVLLDSGANTGLIVSASDFQKGAFTASEYTNIHLMTWEGFQETFVDRWYQKFMAPQLRREVDALIEYTEPINSRIFQKADALPEVRREEFKALRREYFVGVTSLIPLSWELAGITKHPVTPMLPLRDTLPVGANEWFPEEVLDASALRPLMDVLTIHYRSATSKFDEVFGERA